MSTLPMHSGVLVAALACAQVAQAQRADCREWLDAIGDTLVRRTDFGNDGPIHPQGTLADLRSVKLCGWQPDNPEPDPYSGQMVDMADAHIFRLDVVFRGLVNPPGPVGLVGEFAPFLYGDSPVMGYIDFDVDANKNSGGELGSAAESRFLANVARFARVPLELKERTPESRDEIDRIFDTDPQYERSGADFSLVMCGCFTPQVVLLEGDGDGLFERGEKWLAYGRFFERAKGYREASGAYNGSEPGLYDPVVQMRFQHDTIADETTITLVWALDQEGAAFLKNEPVEVIDLDVSNHASVMEALADIIAGADGGGLPDPVWQLVKDWAGKHAGCFLDMGEWGEITCLFGAPYTQPEATFYAWTDTASVGECYGDLDGNGVADDADEQLIIGAVYENDGTPRDLDGARNGVWLLKDPGWNFSLYDTDGNMQVDLFDAALYGPLGDFDGDGTVNIQDFIAFLNAWAAELPIADFNLDQKVDTQDFIAFLNAWVDG